MWMFPPAEKPIPSARSRAHARRHGMAAAAFAQVTPSGEDHATFPPLTRKRVPVQTTRWKSSPGSAVRGCQFWPSIELSISPPGPTTTQCPAP